MPRRRQWSQLSENYRKRLRGAGISKDQYERGENLKKARGHENTPENASDRRRKLAQKLFEKKERIWGTNFKWNGPEAKKIMLQGSSGKKGDPVEPLTTLQLEFLVSLDDDEFAEFVQELDFDQAADQTYKAAAFYH